MKYTESDIIEMIKEGADSKVFLFLYKQIYPKVRAYIVKTGGDPEESKDIFQDALLVFCKKVKTGEYRHDTEIDGYIYAVSKNLWINRIKKKSRTSKIDIHDLHISDSTEDAERYMIIKEGQNKVAQMLDALGERCKELLINSSYLKMSMKEIAEKMGFTNENAAKTKNYKCKQRLLALIEENEEIKDLFA
jgi:RNA polymerase sigma factor (sigma-70 family)